MKHSINNFIYASYVLRFFLNRNVEARQADCSVLALNQSTQLTFQSCRLLNCTEDPQLAHSPYCLCLIIKYPEGTHMHITQDTSMHPQSTEHNYMFKIELETTFITLHLNFERCNKDLLAIIIGGITPLDTTLSTPSSKFY